MNQEKIEDNLEDKSYWRFAEVDMLGPIPFLRLEHYCHKISQVLLINFNQIKAVRQICDDQGKGFIKVVADEKLLDFCNDLLGKGCTYSPSIQALTLTFNRNTRVGEYLESYFLYIPPAA